MEPNISWITDTLATGGDLDILPENAYDQRKSILEQGIGYVVDLRQEMSDEVLWKDKDVIYAHIPTNDADGWTVPPEVFDAVVDLARKADTDGTKILVHCHMGVNRGPSAAYAVLLDRGMDPIKAYDLIREKRPYAGLAYAVDAYRAHLVRTGKKTAAIHDLQDHIDKVWTEEDYEQINHVIAAFHVWDAEKIDEIERRFEEEGS